MRIRTTICLSLLFATTAAVRAEKEYVTYLSDGPHIGLVTGSDVERNALAYGWQVEYNANPWFSLDLAVTRHEDEVRPGVLSGLGIPPGAAVDLDVVALALTGKVNLWEIDQGLVYAGAGVGYYFFNDDVGTVDRAIDSSGNGNPVVDFDADIHKSFGYHFSLGSILHLSRKWDGFLEGRYALLDSDVTYTVVRRNPGSGALADQRIDSELKYDHLLVRVGVNYRF